MHHEVIEISSDDDADNDDKNCGHCAVGRIAVRRGSRAGSIEEADIFSGCWEKNDGNRGEAATEDIITEQRMPSYYLYNFVLILESVRKYRAPLVPFPSALRSNCLTL